MISYSMIHFKMGKEMSNKMQTLLSLKQQKEHQKKDFTK